MNVIEYSLLDFYMKVQQDNCTQFRTIHYLLWNDPLFVMERSTICYARSDNTLLAVLSQW